MSRRKHIYAESGSGELFVLVEAIMHPLVPMIDGLTLSYFGTRAKPGPAYLSIDRAIAWLREEAKYNGDAAKALPIMERHYQEFQAERATTAPTEAPDA